MPACAFQGSDIGGAPTRLRSGMALQLDAAIERSILLHRSKAWHDAASVGWQLLIEDGHSDRRLGALLAGRHDRDSQRRPLAGRDLVRSEL